MNSFGQAVLAAALLLLGLSLASCSSPDGTPPVEEMATATIIAPTVSETAFPSPTLEAVTIEVTPDIEESVDTPEPEAVAQVENNEPAKKPETPLDTLEISETPAAETISAPTPTLATAPVEVNGMPAENFLILADNVRDNVRRIAAAGAGAGRDLNRFSILGDSLIATDQSLAHWDSSKFSLGPYEHLQQTLDQYKGSFSRYGVSVRVGLHSWSVFDPLWSDKEFCQANEDLLQCEIRLNNPSMLLIFLGSNDAGSPGGFNVNYRQVVQSAIDQGIIPILTTKADRFEGPENTNNTMIRQIAADFEVPLLEFDLLADVIPARGISNDNIHLTYIDERDYGNTETLQYGYPVHNLATLMMLDAVRREVEQ